ncbi:MAG: prolipoprotein diacylglyceryl transferase [Candidatus Cloacimonadia bacterium]
MIKYPDINPTIFEIGPFEIRWYSLMYIISFIIAYFWLKRKYRKRGVGLKENEFESLFFYIILGVLIGGRLGYVVFYNLKEYLQNPLEIFAVWHGGMSFHGGMIGTIFFTYLFARHHKYNFYKLADPAVVIAPLGLALGRLGNFINAELYGRPTNLPWGMLFPGETQPRHPSQLYELLFEGIILFLILFFMEKKKPKDGVLFWSFLFFYGIFRLFIEFFREPDPQLGFIIGFLTMGQILCLAMILAAVIGFLSLHHSAKNQ